MHPRVWGPLAGRSISHYISGSLTVCKSLILTATKEESAMRRTMNRSHIRGGCNSNWRRTTKCLILPLVRFVFILGGVWKYKRFMDRLQMALEMFACSQNPSSLYNQGRATWECWYSAHGCQTDPSVRWWQIMHNTCCVTARPRLLRQHVPAGSFCAICSDNNHTTEIKHLPSALSFSVISKL